MTRGTFEIQSLGCGVTVVDARSGCSFARHSHDDFGIGVVTAGAQRSWSGRGPVEAVAGNIITVNPAETHDGAPIGPERSWSMLYLSPATVGSVVAELSDGRFASRELHAPVVDDPRVARLFRATRAAALADPSGAAFAERLLLLVGTLIGTKPQAPSFPHRLVLARRRIDADPACPHALADLAAIAGLNRFETVRGFARLTGMTPHAYVVQRRLELARRMIGSGATLAHAAADAGFADQSHMHRAFVARHGFTPGAYAAALRRATSFKTAVATSC